MADIAKANAEALKKLLEARPFWVDIQPAIECVPGMKKNLILHAGPPVTWERMCGPQRGATIGALIYEGMAKNPEEAEELAASGEIEFDPCHHHDTVGPMAGIVCASMPMIVTENEVRDYYESHKAEYVEQEAREVRHILVSPFRNLADGTVSSTAGEGEWEAARTEAEKVRNEIRNGADFITQVEQYSDDDATNENGGKLGAIIRGQMVPAFDEAVFSLQKGDLSEPVKTRYGYHIIQVTDITPERQITYDQVKETIRTTLLNQKLTKTWEAWLASKVAELGVAYRDGYAPSAQSAGAGLDRSLAPATTTTAD